MITSFIKILELPNFGHMTTSTIKFDSCDKMLLVTSCTEIKRHNPFFKNTFILRTPRVANFAGNLKIATMFIKKIFETIEKLEITC